MLRTLVIMALLLRSMWANEAIVEEVKVTKDKGMYNFSVRILHEDSGWEHYVNRYEILNEKGHLLATRILVHPHENEQPFTRTLNGVVMKDLKKVYVRAHDSVDGYSKLYEVTLP